MAKKKVKETKPNKREVTIDDLIKIHEKIIENDIRLESRIDRIVSAIHNSKSVKGL